MIRRAGTGSRSGTDAMSGRGGSGQVVAQDLRYAVRRLRRQPGFLVVALLTLGLGVGANVAMFGVADLAVFRALPFPEADRLVLARTTFGPRHARNIWTSSWPDYEDYRDGTSTFASLAAVAPMTLDGTLEGAGKASRVSVSWVSPGFFRTLGVPLTAGREFLPEENEGGAGRVAVISRALWLDRFAGEPGVVGSQIRLDGEPTTVVGVAPAGFSFIVDADVWEPVAQAGWGMARQSHNWILVGRLAPGATRASAQAEVDVVAARLRAEYPASNEAKGLLLTGLQEALVEGFGPTLFALWLAVGMVLLVACANVAGLLLARAPTRRTEMAARAALGAGRGRLVRQLLAEHAVVGLAAAALGTVLALAFHHTLVVASPLARLGVQPTLHPVVLIFAAGIAVATVVLFGLPPALVGARVDVAEDLKAGVRHSGTPGSRLQAGLVVAQVALSLVLLLGAGLLARGVARLRHVDPGFATERVLTAEIGLPVDRYPDGPERTRYFGELLTRVRALPEVAAAGLVSRIPIRDFGDMVGVWEPSAPPLDASEVRLAFQRTVYSGYFEALGIPLLAGRDVRVKDSTESPAVLVISRSLADALFPGADPLGRTVVVDLAADTARLEVVGVVGDVRVSSLAAEPEMAMYFPYHQRPFRTMGLVVRGDMRPDRLAPAVRGVLQSVDPGVPLGRVASMDQVLAESLGFVRTVTGALAGFAAVAVLLATLGLYGLLAYQVARRRHEIGVRMALGAGSGDVSRLVLRRGLRHTALGMLLGAAVLGTAALVLRFPRIPVRASDPTVVFRLAVDPLVIVGGGLLLLLVAVGACLLPARRALRIDPLAAIRSE